MRKADYATLARLIKDRREVHTELHSEASKTPDSIGRGHAITHHLGALGALDSVARAFASSASVDPAEFLRACGLD